jgi:hypothetical protein
VEATVESIYLHLLLRFLLLSHLLPSHLLLSGERGGGECPVTCPAC